MPATLVAVAPKYLRMKQLLADQIRSGQLTPGQRLQPERELMRRFSVSYSTASRALGELSDAGLIERRWGKGTFVRYSHPATINVAVAFDRIHHSSDPYWAPMLQGVLATEASHPWQFHLFPLPEASIFSGANTLLLPRLLKERALQGVILCSASSPEDVQQLEALGVPFVSVGIQYPSAGMPWVIEDIDDGARQVIAHLVDSLGHRRIHLVVGPQGGHTARIARSSALVGEALIRELRARAIPSPPTALAYPDADLSWPSVAAQVRAWLTSDRRPTALVCITDVIAARAIELAGQLGLKVPEDLSVATWGDVLPGSNLTAVQVPFQDLGRRAVELLERKLKGQDAPSETLPVWLISRQTTGPVKAA